MTTEPEPDPRRDAAIDRITRNLQARADELLAAGFTPDEAWVQAVIEQYPRAIGADAEPGASETAEILGELFRTAFRYRALDPTFSMEHAWGVAVKHRNLGGHWK